MVMKIVEVHFIIHVGFYPVAVDIRIHKKLSERVLSPLLLLIHTLKKAYPAY